MKIDLNTFFSGCTISDNVYARIPPCICIGDPNEINGKFRTDEKSKIITRWENRYVLMIWRKKGDNNK